MDQDSKEQNLSPELSEETPAAESVEVPAEPVGTPPEEIETPAEAAGESISDAPAEDGVQPAAEPGELPAGIVEEPAEAPQKGRFKSLLKKWWFWLIVVAVVGGIVVGIVLASNSSKGGSGSSSSYSAPAVYVDPYVTLVKTARNSNYGVTYGAAFDSFFTSPRWESFTASSGEKVVEFNGGFLYSGKPATATFQFVLDFANDRMSVEYLAINGQAQNRLMLATFLQKIFESY